MPWINRHLHVVTTYSEALKVLRSVAAGAERSRLELAGEAGDALGQGIAATRDWEKYLAGIKAHARRLGPDEGKTFAEIEDGIELAVAVGLKDASAQTHSEDAGDLGCGLSPMG